MCEYENYLTWLKAEEWYFQNQGAFNNMFVPLNAIMIQYWHNINNNVASGEITLKS